MADEEVSSLEYISRMGTILERRGNFLVYNTDMQGTGAIDELIALLQSCLVSPHPMIDFQRFLSLQAPKLSDMDGFIHDAYRYELESSRTHKNLPKTQPLIYVTNVFDPQVYMNGNQITTYFYERLRRVLTDERYNPGLRYVLLENPVIGPKISRMKKNNPLHGSVMFFDLSTGAESELPR